MHESAFGVIHKMKGHHLRPLLATRNRGKGRAKEWADAKLTRSLRTHGAMPVDVKRMAAATRTNANTRKANYKRMLGD